MLPKREVQPIDDGTGLSNALLVRIDSTSDAVL